MVLKNLLLDNILAELEQIDAMDEVLFWQIVAFAFTDAFNCFHSKLQVFHDLFKAK